MPETPTQSNARRREIRDRITKAIEAGPDLADRVLEVDQ